MRELLGPWQHFFFFETKARSVPEGELVVGGELARDFLAAKGTESYAGIATNELRQSAGGTLRLAVTTDQPLVFNAGVTEQLRDATAFWGALGAARCGKSTTTRSSAESSGPPTRRSRLAPMQAYAAFKRGELAQADQPDLSDIYPEDPQTRAEMGLPTEPGAGGPDLLIQACGSRHNDVLDQTISRARFSIALGRMDRAERELAVQRVGLPADDVRVMPPHGAAARRSGQGAAGRAFADRYTQRSRGHAPGERGAQGHGP